MIFPSFSIGNLIATILYKILLNFSSFITHVHQDNLSGSSHSCRSAILSSAIGTVILLLHKLLTGLPPRFIHCFLSILIPVDRFITWTTRYTNKYLTTLQLLEQRIALVPFCCFNYNSYQLLDKDLDKH